MKFYEITTDKIKELAKQRDTTGYRLIADDIHTAFKRVDALQRVLVACVGTPEIYRNYNNELTFNFDSKGE